jgi:hypothetical protein
MTCLLGERIRSVRDAQEIGVPAALPGKRAIGDGRSTQIDR